MHSHHHSHLPRKTKTKDAQVEILTETIAGPSANYLENNIVKFIHVLRHLDVRVSAAEAMDAIRAVEMINILNPPEVKAALQSTLIKDSRSKILFDKAFDVFFAPPEEGEQRKKNLEKMKAEAARQMQQAEEELVFNWYEQTPEGRTEGKEKLNLTEEEKKTYSRLSEEAKQKLLEHLKKPMQKNPINNPQNLLESMVRSQLNYWKRFLLSQDLNNVPIEVEPTGDEVMDQMLLDIIEEVTDDTELMYEDIQKIPEKDIPKAKALIWKLSRQLATRISRRYRASKKHRKLDMRSTIRKNIKYGGSLYELKFKAKRVEKPKVVLIGDVSGSMAKYCSFVLQFIYGLASVIEEIETFVFSEDVEKITGDFAKGIDFEETMANIINKSEQWGKGTDLGKALEKIMKNDRQLFNKDTFVIIVSDTKTQSVDLAGEKVSRLKNQVQDIIWLNTLPRKEWASSKAVKLFRRQCRMFECNTLAHLEKIMRTQLF